MDCSNKQTETFSIKFTQDSKSHNIIFKISKIQIQTDIKKSEHLTQGKDNEQTPTPTYKIIKDFKAAIIIIHQEIKANTLEVNGNIISTKE